MDANVLTDEFVAKYNGQYIDEDHAFGSQCWDVVARYAREVWGCPFFPTGSGGAEGLYRLFQAPIPSFFDKVPASDLQKGDIVVWSASFYPPYGHTALLWKREGNTIFVLEQDGSNDPNGDDIADGVSYIAQRTINNYVAGGLRPKAEGADNMTQQDAEELAQQIGLISADPNWSDPSWVSDQARHIVADPKYAAALIKQEYNSKRWQEFNYRGVHYEDDVKAAAGGGKATPLGKGLYQVN